MTERTLGVHLDKFKPVEKGFIVWLMNFSNHLGYQVHPGMLPFLTADSIIAAHRRHFAKVQDNRVAAQVRDKVKSLYNIGESQSWRMDLDNAKVARRFGAHPERGHRIPLVMPKRVTVGVRWSLPKRDYEPDDNVMVQPHVTLKCIHGCTWYITCEKKYFETVYHFLVDNCK